MDYTPKTCQEKKSSFRWGAALVLLLLACSAGAQTAKRPHVLLVSIDTLRADTLHVYGFEQEISPNIDAIAGRGALFEDVMATIGKTGPSFSSLFSSLYPPTHGARRNGLAINPDVAVLPQILSEAGWTTAAFVSNWTLRPELSGLSRGFDHYDANFDKSRYAIGPKERDASTVTQDTLEWLETWAGFGSEDPLFLWAHYSDPHSPYRLREGFEPPRPSKSETDKSEMPMKRWRYASEVGYADHWIGELLKGAREYLAPENTILIIVSDHGEAFGEHGYSGHGKNTHWPNLRVPLILEGPGIPKGQRFDAPVSTVDLLPTILELLDLPRPLGIEGISLTRAWSGEFDRTRTRHAFGDRGVFFSSKKPDKETDPLEISLQDDSVKTIYDFKKRTVRFYDLIGDPLELKPLSRSPVEYNPPLSRQLASWYRDLKKIEGPEANLDDQDLEELRLLGYITDEPTSAQDP